MLIKNNLYIAEKLSAKYLWTVLDKCLNVVSHKASTTASIMMNLQNGIISNRNMYRGAVDIATLYINDKS